ncbi:MAG: alkaline phosphatase family protein [Thermoprotei archaeon]
MYEKIAVIGLDALSWEILDMLINEGYFSHLSEVLDNSLKTNLISTTPPITPPAWTSIASGVNPGKHGIYSFYNIVKHPVGFSSKLVTGREACYPRIHEIMPLYRKKCLVANLPATYHTPSYVSKYCIVVSDWLSPIIRVNIPRFSFLEEAFAKNSTLKHFKKPEVISSKISERIGFIIKALINVVETIKLELLFIIFSEFDWVMHKDIDFLKGNDLNLYRDLTTNIDDFVNYLKKRGYSIILVSDHGFSIYNKALYPEKVLEIYGIRSGDIGYSWKKNRFVDKIASFIRRHPILRTVARKLLVKVRGEASTQRIIPYDLVQVLLPDPHYMFLSPNVTSNTIKEIFKEYGFVQVYTGKEIYKGYCTDRAPDIVLKPRGYDVLIARGKPEQPFKEGIEVADHSYIGIFSVEGFNDVKWDHVYTWDVTPVILSLLGLPIPSDTDSTLELVDRLGIKYTFDNVRAKWLIANRISRISS